MTRDVVIGAGLGGITGAFAGGLLAYFVKKKKKEDVLNVSGFSAPPPPPMTTEATPSSKKDKNLGKTDPLVENLKRIRSPDFLDVFELIVRTYEFFGNTKAFISLCRNVELLLDLSCVVSENGLKIEPVLLRKGSLYLARIKSSIIDLSAEVKPVYEMEYQENSKQLLEILDGYYQNIVSDVTLKM